MSSKPPLTTTEPAELPSGPMLTALPIWTVPLLTEIWPLEAGIGALQDQGPMPVTAVERRCR